jgi:hypothetical protein
LPRDQMLKHAPDKVFQTRLNVCANVNAFRWQKHDAVFVFSMIAFPQEAIKIIGGMQCL